MYYDPTKSIAFIEQRDGGYYNKEGYTLTKVGDSEEYTLSNSQGVVVGCDYPYRLKGDDGRKVKIISRMRNHWRNKEGVNKINIGHLTVGTIFEASVLSKGPEVYKVHSVVCNGPGSYCVYAATKNSDAPLIFSEFASFNIKWIKRIISRVPGTVKITSRDTRRCIERVIPKYADIEDIIHAFITNNDRYSEVKAQRRRIDREKLLKRLDAMGLRKKSCISNYLTSLYPSREVLKFLDKNPHWAYTTIK